MVSSLVCRDWVNGCEREFALFKTARTHPKEALTLSRPHFEKVLDRQGLAAQTRLVVTVDSDRCQPLFRRLAIRLVNSNYPRSDKRPSMRSYGSPGSPSYRISHRPRSCRLIPVAIG